MQRIGRTLADQLARGYRDTAGQEGIPVMNAGSTLRVPRWALLELVRTGRVVVPDGTGGPH